MFDDNGSFLLALFEFFIFFAWFMSQIIAALLAFRFCYFLVPLVPATLTFAALELNGRPARKRALR